MKRLVAWLEQRGIYLHMQISPGERINQGYPRYRMHARWGSGESRRVIELSVGRSGWTHFSCQLSADGEEQMGSLWLQIPLIGSLWLGYAPMFPKHKISFMSHRTTGIMIADEKLFCYWGKEDGETKTQAPWSDPTSARRAPVYGFGHWLDRILDTKHIVEDELHDQDIPLALTEGQYLMQIRTVKRQWRRPRCPIPFATSIRQIVHTIPPVPVLPEAYYDNNVLGMQEYGTTSVAEAWKWYVESIYRARRRRSHKPWVPPQIQTSSTSSEPTTS